MNGEDSTAEGRVQAVISLVGESRFIGAKHAYRSFARGDISYWSISNDPLIHEVADSIGYYIWEFSDLSVTDRIALMFDIYDEIPSSAILAYSIDYLGEMPRNALELYWNRMNKLLNDRDSSSAGPVVYFLHDYIFERPELVDDAWLAVTSDLTAERRLKRVIASKPGLVPMHLRLALYRKLINLYPWAPKLISDDLQITAADPWTSFDSKAALEILKLIERNANSTD